MRAAPALAAAGLALVSCGPQAALAANAPLTALAPHGAPAAGDLIPIQSPTGPSLQSATAADLQNFALTSLNGFPGVDPTGQADSTAGIQAAINTGKKLYCDGVYKTSGTLNFTSSINNGQILTGSGSSDSSGAVVSGRCTFHPTGNVRVIFKLDGANFLPPNNAHPYLQNVDIRDLSIDMVDMPDSSESVAFYQLQAFDIEYENIRVYNDGLNKRGWLFNAGSYTTSLKDTQAHVIDMEGQSGGNGVTTISIINHDGGKVVANFAGNVRILGGAFQGLNETKFYLRNDFMWDIKTDIEGTGIAYDLSTSDTGISMMNELQGFSGISLQGVPGVNYINFDQSSNQSTFPYSLTAGEIQLNNQGQNSINQLYSGSNSASVDLRFGRVSLDALCGISSGSTYVGADSAGDFVCETLNANTMWFAPHQGAAGMLSLTSVGVNTYGKGNILGGTVQITPTTNGADKFDLYSASGQPVIDCGTSAIVSASACNMVNGSQLIGFSDSFLTQTYRLNASTGSMNLRNLAIEPVADGIAIFEIDNSANNPIFDINTSSVSQNGTVAVNNGAKLKGFSDSNFTQKWSIDSSTGTISVNDFLVNSKLQISASTPIYLSGFSSGVPSIVGSTTAAFTLVLGATPGSTGSLTMPSASLGWVCVGTDRTNAGGIIRETSTASNSVTFSLSAMTSGDILQFQCFGY